MKDKINNALNENQGSDYDYFNIMTNIKIIWEPLEKNYDYKDTIIKLNQA